MTLSTHAQEQAEHWGTDPEGWRDHAETHTEPLFRAVLDAAASAPGRRLLDVGCGTGGALVLAEGEGWTVSGVDVAEPLLELARERLSPDAALLVAEADVLPFSDASFDAVIGVNAFQFAEDPVRALREAARVLVPGGRLVVSLFAAPERSESTAIHRALTSLAAQHEGERPPTAHVPYLLSEPGNLEGALLGAGLGALEAGEVELDWAYADLDAVVRGLLASAGGARTASVAGREATAQAVRDAVVPFTAPDGSVHLHNTFRWVAATREEV